MIGKIRKKLLPPILSVVILDPIICPICSRSIPESQKDAHHLIPKSKGGKSAEYLHRICGRLKQHKTLDELANAICANSRQLEAIENNKKLLFSK